VFVPPPCSHCAHPCVSFVALDTTLEANQCISTALAAPWTCIYMGHYDLTYAGTGHTAPNFDSSFGYLRHVPLMWEYYLIFMRSMICSDMLSPAATFKEPGDAVGGKMESGARERAVTRCLRVVNAYKLGITFAGTGDDVDSKMVNNNMVNGGAFVGDVEGQGGGGLWRGIVIEMRRLRGLSSSIFDGINARGVFHQGLQCGTTASDYVWSQYTDFEGQNAQLKEAMVVEWEPKYNHSKAVALERMGYGTMGYDSFGAAPDGQLTQTHADLVNKIKKRVAYERTNPENITDGKQLRAKIRQTYKNARSVLYRHPEQWADWFGWEEKGESSMGGGSGGTSALRVLSEACVAVPDSCLLAIVHSEALEEAGDAASAVAIYESFLNRAPCSMGFVMMERLARRVQGIEEARRVFSRARR